MNYWKVTLLLGIFLCFSVRPIVAGPIDPYFPTTIREYITTYDAAVIARFVPQKRRGTSQSSVRYEVRRIVSTSPDSVATIGDRITLLEPRIGDGKLFLIAGRKQTDGKPIWSHPLAIRDSSLDYICHLASLLNSNKSILPYCMSLIESKDVVVSNDVHEELSRASIKELTTAANLMRRDRLAVLFADPNTPFERTAIYGLMLGLCGDAESEDLLREMVFDRRDTRRAKIGFQRIICGYILLTGAKGVTDVRNHWLVDHTVPINEAFAAAHAIKMIWLGAPDDLRPNNLSQALHPLLERKDCGDIAVSDLAQMKDWSVQYRIAQMYDTADEYTAPTLLRKEIIAYMKASKKDVPKGEADVPTHAKMADAFLQTIKSPAEK